MTVAATPTTATYASVTLGVGLPFPAPLQDADDLRVLYADGSIAAVLGVDYTLGILPDYSAATVTPLAGLVTKADGGAVTLSRESILEQTLALAGATRLPEVAMERALDRLMLIAQELKTRVLATLNLVGATMIDLAGRRFINSAAPVNGGDLCNKTYTDGVAAAALLGVVPDNSIVEAKLAPGLTGAKFAAASIPMSKVADDSKTILREAAQRTASGASVTGTVDAIVVDVSADLSGGLTQGLVVAVRHIGANVSTTPNMNVKATGVKTIVKGANLALNPGDISDVGFTGFYMWDATLTKWIMLNPATGVVAPATSVFVPVRQTALAGPRDVSGFPNFLPGVSATLSLTTQNLATTALVVAAAQGFSTNGAADRVGRTSANFTWAALTANTTLYLFLSVAANGTVTPGFTALAPIYQRDGAPSTANGQYTYVVNEATMYLGNGATASPVFVVFVGECVTSGAGVTSTIAYAYQGRYTSAETAVQAGGLTTQYSHNVGVPAEFLDADTKLRCKVTINGYAVGDVVRPMQLNYLSGTDSSGNNPTVLEGRLTARVQSGNYGLDYASTKTAPTGRATAAAANWNQFVTVERAF